MLNINWIFCVLLKYLFVVVIATVLGATLYYWLYPTFSSGDHDHNYYDSSLGVAFVIVFFTYNVYIVSFKLSKLKKKSLKALGFFCLIVSILFWGAIQLLTFGFDITGTILIILSIGVSTYFIPHLDVFISKALHINTLLPRV